MIANRKIFGIVLAVIGVGLSVMVFCFAVNYPAYVVKKKVSSAIQSHIDDAEALKKIKLSEVGEQKWDFACVAGGIDYSRTTGAKTVKESLKNIDLSGFKTSDLTLNNKENGLVFISLSRKILVTVAVDAVLGREASQKTRHSYGLCLPAEKAYLLSGKAKKKQRHLILKEEGTQ